MRSHLLLVTALAVGCGETQFGPFQSLPVDTRFDVQDNDGIIHIARDRYGVTHIYATTVGDLGFAQGYMMAHDRLAQMDVLRRFAEGRLAEIFGVVDPSVLQLDKEMRFHRMEQFAIDRFNSMGDETDVKTLLVRFAAGVNAYVDDVNAGKWPTDSGIASTDLGNLFAPTRFKAWSPVDSIAIMRLFTFAQSWTVPEELELTELDLRARALPTAARLDLLALAPIPKIGTSFNPAAPRGGPTNRPLNIANLVASARAFFPRTLPASLAETLGPHALARPFLGSTAFALGEAYTETTFPNPLAILAADMQLAPSNPSVFYPAHQIVATGGDTEAFITHDVIGLMLPGVPVVIAGTNGEVGWAPTRNTFDVNDLYYEDLTNETIMTTTEMFDIGDYGEIARSEFVSYDFVPRHGPIIPGHPMDEALSVRYTGYGATDELEAIWAFGASAGAADVAFGLLALQHGPQFMTIDFKGAYAWASDSHVPMREPGAMTWSTSNLDGAAPFFVLNGKDVTQDWAAETQTVAIDYGRRLEDAIIIADGDPTDATHDGDPLNGDYVGVTYNNSLRDERIRTLVDTIVLPIDKDKLARIQHDTLSTLGERLKPKLLEILNAAPASPQTTLAANVLDAWTFETPIANIAPDGNSAATLLFNRWMHEFVMLAIADDLATIGYTQPLDDDRIARIVYRMLVENRQALCGGNCTPLVVTAATRAVDALGLISDSWRWGAMHAFRLRPLFPDQQGALLLPRMAEPIASFQSAGDMFSVDRSDGGWADADFTPQITTAYRMQILGSPGAALVLRLELPTGAVFDPRDPHYRDLLERSYLTRTPFDVPRSIKDINKYGESRWEMR